MTIHYRVNAYESCHEVRIVVEQFVVVKETPQGYWITHTNYKDWDKEFGLAEMKRSKLLKWVSKTSTKRYAYPSLTEAMISFRRRKQRQVMFLRSTLETAQVALDKFEEYCDTPIEEFTYRGKLIHTFKQVGVNFTL